MVKKCDLPGSESERCSSGRTNRQDGDAIRIAIAGHGARGKAEKQRESVRSGGADAHYSKAVPARIILCPLPERCAAGVAGE